MRINWYRVLSARNDIRAIRKGPKATYKRVVRKAVYRNVNQATRKILKGLGL